MLAQFDVILLIFISYIKFKNFVVLKICYIDKASSHIICPIPEMDVVYPHTKKRSKRSDDSPVKTRLVGKYSSLSCNGDFYCLTYTIKTELTSISLVSSRTDSCVCKN